MRASFKRRRRVVQDDGPDPIDVFVGQRVRERRLQAGLSQNELAEPLGVGFQAVQKSASTLYRLAQALGVEPSYFFEGYASVKRRK